MSYPQQPYPQQPQPQWGPAGPGLPPKAPSGGTTITAAILAVLSGLISGFFLVTSLIAIIEYLNGAFGSLVFLLSFGGQAISFLLLVIGGIMLFARAGAGRVMVIIGTVVKVALVVWSFIDFPRLPITGLTIVGLAVLLMALVASVLAILPSTAAYIAAKKKGPQGYPQQGPPPGYPPQQPYGQPQQGYGPPQQGMPPQGPPQQGYPQGGYGPPPR